MGERQNHKGKALMGHRMRGMHGSASTGAAGYQELPSRAEVLQEPTSCIRGHQPLHLATSVSR